MRISDWSSDVCSSDLNATCSTPPHGPRRHPGSGADPLAFAPFQTTGPLLEHTRAPTLHRAAPARLVGTGLAGGAAGARRRRMVRLAMARSEEHTSELQSLMRISYAVFCLKKKTKKT